ncbi:hypothetical protein KKB55_13800 [Myxococcota bacterium]|nr:hypothetical protein [Myxococcota bacterium]
MSLSNEPNEPNGPTAARWPLSTIKAAILGAKVNEARCIMEGRRTYTDLTTIVRNETNLSRSLDELLTPSSIIPEPKASKIEALSATEENLETLRKHADELIRRIKSADPYRPSLAGQSGAYRGAESARYNRSHPPSDVNEPYRAEACEVALEHVSKGIITPGEAMTQGIGLTQAEVDRAFAEGAEWRAVNGPHKPLRWDDMPNLWEEECKRNGWHINGQPIEG